MTSGGPSSPDLRGSGTVSITFNVGEPLLPLPRIRFHWMVKNIDGLWATAALSDRGAADGTDTHKRE